MKDFKIGDKVYYKNLTKFKYTVIGFEDNFLVTKSGKSNGILIKKENAVKI